MKRAIILFLSLCIPGLLAAESDTVRFVYVVQNPLLFGNNAKAWFEIEGLQNKTVAKKINDTLRKAFVEKTEFDTFDIHWATMRNDDHTPKGYTDYSFFNGQTYGNGWIRFRNSDSTVRLTKADGYYGSGKNLGSFSQEVAEGRLAWIGIYTSRFHEDGSFDDRAIDFAFDLRNGNVIADKYPVRIDPSKRDSLENVLTAKVNHEINNKEREVKGTIIHAYPFSDTVVVTVAQLIRWMNGAKPIYPVAISRYYDASVITNNLNYQIWKPMAFLTFDEAVPFFLEEDWNKVKSL